MPNLPTTIADDERVCAVVVTFNRKALLRLCLDSLHRQSRAIDEIVIVNNASTDGTEILLRDEYPQLRVLQQSYNLGGAGGFHAGMKWAVEKQFDWIWVMDDDITMRPDSLEVMLSYGGIADMIHSRKQLNDGVMTWEAIWNAEACNVVTCQRDVAFENGRDWTSISYSCFEGALIRGALVERAGLPDVRYFVAGDDTVYGLVASQHGHVIYIKYVGVDKNISARTTPAGRMMYYLSIRNRFLTYETFERCGIPVNRKIFLIQCLYGVLQHWSNLVRTPASRTWVNVRAPLEGLIHGWKGRFGKPYWIK